MTVRVDQPGKQSTPAEIDAPVDRNDDAGAAVAKDLNHLALVVDHQPRKAINPAVGRDLNPASVFDERRCKGGSGKERYGAA